VDAVTRMNSLEGRMTLDRGSRSEVVSQLFLTHQRRLVGLAALLVDDHETAEDLVQEAFASLHRRLASLHDHNAALTYLNRAVVNGARDRLRHRRRRREDPRWTSPTPEPLASAEHTALARDEREHLWRAVEALPTRQRQVLVLRYYLNQSEAEIAETLNVSAGSVKTHASRGLAALARTWEEES
jgi:RNA polymerase sigma-70 factor (sigma-E family)